MFCYDISSKIGYINYHIILNIVIISFINSLSSKTAKKIGMSLHKQLICYGKELSKADFPGCKSIK